MSMPEPGPSTAPAYHAILVVGFGGPEQPADVMPFLENVLRGKPVPRERMLEVAEHYQHFGGVSPINAQARELIAALRPELDARGCELPIYWGNRNWHPMLEDTVRAMAEAGIRHALAVVLSAYSSYSGCRQYREDLIRAREAVGPDAPTVDKVRVFYNHPDWVEVNADRVRRGLSEIPEGRREAGRVAFTAHSIPDSMAVNCRYEEQLRETCRLVAEAAGVEPDRWDLVYQSRSGRPTDPWLAPDILDHVEALHARGVGDVVVQPIGFLSDHMEVLFDLDEEAKQKADGLGMNLVRAGTAGADARFVALLGELVVERITARADRRAIGAYPPNHDVCPVDCCLPPPRPGRPSAA